MAAKPPLLPSETLSRVRTLATVDGRIVLFLAGSFAILSAIAHNLPGALIGCVAAGAGALELHGVGLLREREVRGVGWLVRSQLLLLGVILIYCAYRMTNFEEVSALVRSRITPELTTALDEANISQEQFVQLFHKIWTAMYVAVGVVSIFYQGGMAFFYHRRRAVVGRALEEEDANESED